MRFWDGVKAASMAVLAVWIGAPEAYRLLVVMNVLDVVSGLTAAGKASEISSHIGWLGIRKKAFMWLLVLSAHALQTSFSFPTVLAGYTPAEIVATSFIVVEAMSVLENAVKVGLPVPGFIVETLRQAQDRLGYDTQRKAGKE